MPELLAISLDVEAAPNVSLVRGDGEGPPVGWAFAWYPEGGQAAGVLRGPTDEEAAEQLDWEAVRQGIQRARRQRSTLYLAYYRAPATRRRVELDPLVRSYAGRDWALAYEGEVARDAGEALALEHHPLLEPVGERARELPLAWLISQLLTARARRLAAVRAERLHEWLGRMDAGAGLGNAALTDGETLVVYRAPDGEPVSWFRHAPPEPPPPIETDGVRVSFDGPMDRRRTVLAAATRPGDELWTEIPPGGLLVARRATVVASVHGATGAQAPPVRRGVPPRREGERTMSVLHETVYTYEEAVGRSSHRFLLTPCHDTAQELLEHALDISVDGRRHRAEDVFGNQATGLEIESPFTEMRVSARSLVRVSTPTDLRPDPDGPQPRLPFTWMPWQRQMLLPYLLPPELPETQLRELTDYAYSFVRRNDGDAFATMWDMTQTINRDFAYVSGSTTLATTPFDVYVTRRGVCQDFANLLICMARLLDVPARYRVGYIFTGTDYENQIQSDASHAWVELFSPLRGWVGVDPTNACLTGLDHVRVACGRNYVDAAPSGGTIWEGGRGERLTVRVEVVPVDEREPAAA